MRTYVRALLIQIRQLFTLRFFIVVFLFTLLHILSVIKMYFDSFQDAWYVVSHSLQTGITFFTIYILSTFVFSHTIVSEWENKYIQLNMIRSGILPYTLSKFLAAAIGGFFCVFFGMSLFCLISYLIFPQVTMITSDDAYNAMILEGKVLQGFLLFIIDMSFSGTVTAVFGMTASVFVMTPYTAVSAPVAFFLIGSRIAESLKLPDEFNPMYWMHAVVSSFDSSLAAKGVLQKGAACITAVMVMTILACHQMLKKVKNE